MLLAQPSNLIANKENDQHYYNILLLAGIVMCLAVDTSVCERGFSLMNNLKTARRSQMGNELLRILMTICSLGEEWKTWVEEGSE